MQLKPQTLDVLALMICGEEGFSDFPYRSSSKLTSFFVRLSLPYTHDGSTRRVWVRGVLDTINSESNANSSQLSENMKLVIESILDFSYFSPDTTTNRERAMDRLNKLLRAERIFLEEDPNNIVHLRRDNGEFISTSVLELEAKRVITFAPSVFSIPLRPVRNDLVSVMMPLAMEFDSVLNTVKIACSETGMECKRADDIWHNSAIIQDIFELIYCSSIVVVDFSGRNQNVFYEVGIAHTLGKNVIPIAQNLGDVPFDLRHHRVLEYLKNSQGLQDLKASLIDRLKFLKQG